MKVADKHVVQFNYTIKDSNDVVLESNEDGEPIAYLHGIDGQLLPTLAAVMTDKEPGDKFSVTLEPAEAFGEMVENAEMRVPIKHLQGESKWKKGMTAVINTDHGRRQVTILKVGKFMATVDGNHPFAGKTATFDIEIVDVRPATEEELQHGHAHGVGGHHH